MLKKAGKNLIKHQIKEFLEGKSVESRPWKIVHKIEQRLTKQPEDNRKRR